VAAAAEQRTYDAALEQFKRADYAGAVTGFTGFVRTYPQSTLAPSAQYWIGNAQFARKDYRAAIAAQRALITQYPDNAKVPDALLKHRLGAIRARRQRRRPQDTRGADRQAPAIGSGGKAKQRLGMR
jgi:tol-pal system protein YbgF